MYQIQQKYGQGWKTKIWKGLTAYRAYKLGASIQKTNKKIYEQVSYIR